MKKYYNRNAKPIKSLAFQPFCQFIKHLEEVWVHLLMDEDYQYRGHGTLFAKENRGMREIILYRFSSVLILHDLEYDLEYLKKYDYNTQQINQQLVKSGMLPIIKVLSAIKSGNIQMALRTYYHKMFMRHNIPFQLLNSDQLAKEISWKMNKLCPGVSLRNYPGFMTGYLAVLSKVVEEKEMEFYKCYWESVEDRAAKAIANLKKVRRT